MTGVVKSVGKYALLAGTALALSISVASAASLTKAGMDKRVADLEREVTLLKNQMKSAMMAKKGPDKNDPVGQQPREGHPLRPRSTGRSASRIPATSTEISTSVDNERCGARASSVTAAGTLNKITTAER